MAETMPVLSSAAMGAADAVTTIHTPEGAASAFILTAVAVGVLMALYQYKRVASVNVDGAGAGESANSALIDGAQQGSLNNPDTVARLKEIHAAIEDGAKSFLWAEYRICFVFIVVFGLIVFLLVGSGGSWTQGAFSFVSFAVGGTTSIVSGYIGMRVAVYANVRTTVSAQRSWTAAFNTAFSAGAVMGFALCSLALVMLYILLNVFRLQWDFAGLAPCPPGPNPTCARFETIKILMECVASYGLGGSSIALFGRVGGGIYTKAADVGADLVGKIEAGIPEDDPRNPGVIADNVGDNVGDVAGMGADLFGSFAEASSAALVVTSYSRELRAHWNSMMFPLLVSACGIFVCFATSFYATHIKPVRKEADVEKALKMQLIVSTVLLTPAIYALAWGFLPETFSFQDSLDNTYAKGGQPFECHSWGAFVCVAVGLWAGLATGIITEYYTSHTYKPTREVAASCKTGAATNIIYGLALGYKSVIVPVFSLAVAIFFSFYLCHMYGVALAALGMLSSLAIGLTIDAYGPVCDNAGGIAEMAELGEHVRDVTDALDAAGNTTAAIGKGFAIGSAALVGLALFGAFVTRVGDYSVDILQPITFAGLIVGAMLPYWFSAMTMKSVGFAANAMVEEIREQFATIPGLMDGTGKPNYKRCIEISTEASLKEMIAPGALVMLAPIITGLFFGTHAVTGLLAGGLVSGVQMAISSSNTGGAWDNAKKYVEQGNFGGKGSECHHAAVVGDTVGDPLKDTSGPSLNILMKLMAIISLVFADFFMKHSFAKGQAWAGYTPAATCTGAACCNASTVWNGAQCVATMAPTMAPTMASL